MGLLQIGSPRLRWSASALFFAVVLPSPVAAQSLPSVSANAKLVSDYRFRGISASSRNPAIQASLDLDTGDILTGVWVSTISNYRGSHVESDWYAGGHYSYGKTDFVLVGYAFIYPGGKRSSTFDLEASVTAPVGRIKTNTLVAWAPQQRNSPKSNIYLSETILYPLGKRGWVLSAHYGFETGNYHDKQDWKLSILANAGILRLEAGVVGSNYRKSAGTDAGTAMVGSIGVFF